jgi:outer membrane lipoprotein-sorting protein
MEVAMRRITRALIVAVLTVVAGVGALGAPGSAQGPAPDLEAVTRRLDDLYRSTGTIARLEITMVTPRQTRTMRVRTWSRGQDRALLVIEQPARDAGTATLRVDRNLWNYLPRISRTMRVPPSMMLSSWMGSDLTNDDLTQSASYRRDFVGAVVGRSDAPSGWLVRYDAREGVVGLWRRIEFVISDDATLPREARYFDRRMRLARIMRFEDVREMDGRRVPTRMVLEPQDQEGRRTEMRYLSVDFDASVPESTFSLTELEQRR